MRINLQITEKRNENYLMRMGRNESTKYCISLVSSPLMYGQKKKIDIEKNNGEKL